MSAAQDKMFARMAEDYGQIRVAPMRYGHGWMAVGTMDWDHDIDPHWENLTGGDNEAMDANEYFWKHPAFVYVTSMKTAMESFTTCADLLAARKVAS